MAQGRGAAWRAAFALLDACVHDPTVTGVGRLPMRTPTIPCPDPDTARLDDPGASPWWRSLDGTWDVRFFDRLAEVPASIVEEDTGRWGSIQVPGSWTTQRADDGSRFVQPHYTNVIMPFDADPPSVPEDNPVGVHRRTVTVPREWRGRRVVLRVGAAESVVGAYVDGVCVGVGTDSRLPNEFDITAHVRPGRRALIVLVVVRWSAATWVEDQDQWWHGGIQRSVTLHSTAPSYLADVKALPGLRGGDGAAGAPTGTLDLELTVDGPARRERGWTVEAAVETLRPAGRIGRTLATTGALDVPVWNGASEGDALLSGMFVEPGVVRGRLEVPAAAPWTHETPARYRVMVTLRGPGRVGGRGRRPAHGVPLRGGVGQRAPDQRSPGAAARGQPARARPGPGARGRRGADPSRPVAHEGPQPQRRARRALPPRRAPGRAVRRVGSLPGRRGERREPRSSGLALPRSPLQRRDRRAGRTDGASGQAPPVDHHVVPGQRVRVRAAPRRGRRMDPSLRPDAPAALRGSADARPVRRRARHRCRVPDVSVDRGHRRLGPLGTRPSSAVDPVRVLPRHGQLERLAVGLLVRHRVDPRVAGRVHLGVARARARA